MLLSNISLEKISLILSVIGIFAVYAIASQIEPQQIEIGSITANLIGYQVSATGIVTEFYWHDGHFFATLSENRDTIKLVMFERDAKKFPILHNVSKGSNMEATGTINEYEHELEIVAKNVRILE